MGYEIRYVRNSDAEAVDAIFRGRTVLQGIMSLPYGPLEQIEKRIAPDDSAFKLVAIDEGSGEMVGFCELVTYPQWPRHRHVGEVNLLIVRDGWEKQGVGRAMMTAMIDLADNWLNLRRLGLFVFTGNERAVRLYRSFGFEIEGTMPDFTFTEGDYMDAHMMGRLNR